MAFVAPQMCTFSYVFIPRTQTLDVSLLLCLLLTSVVVCRKVYESAFKRSEPTLVVWFIDYGHIGSVCILK